MGATTEIIRGARAGVAATAAMTAFMVGAQALGLFRKMPPQKITEAAFNAATDEVPGKAATAPLTGVVHFAYGAAGGAAFALVRRPSRSAIAQGAGFGLLLWAGSYAGWVPAAGIMPPPQRDRPGRQLALVAGHLVYGLTLGRRLR